MVLLSETLRSRWLHAAVRAALAVAAPVLVAGTAARAQRPMPEEIPSTSSNEGTSDRPATTGIETWLALGAHSPRWGIFGDTRDRALAIMAVRVTHRIRATPIVALDYTVDAIPFVRLSPAPPPDIVPNSPCPSGAICPVAFFPSGSTYAAGVSPVGLQAVFHPGRPWQLRVGASSGVLWFDRAVPVADATRFNFTAMVEAGAQYLNSRGRGVSITYRLHHLSNAGMGVMNPGVASQLIALGARWRLSP